MILVDDHALLRNGIKNRIENRSDFKVLCEAGTIKECEKIIADFTSEKNLAKDFVAVVDISFRESVQGGEAYPEDCKVKCNNRLQSVTLTPNIF